MGGRAGSGAGMGSRSGRFDFASEAMAQGHPLFERLRKEAYDKTMNSIDKNIKDTQLKAEMKAAVEKMHKEMGGLPTGYDVKILSSKEFQRIGGSGFEFGVNYGGGIALNSRYFGHGYKRAENIMKQQIARGIFTDVKKPAIKTFVHEFGHGYYDRLSAGGKEQVAQVFSTFKSSTTKGWGSNSKKSAAEFYSDAVAKSVLGGSDKWTKALGKIK